MVRIKFGAHLSSGALTTSGVCIPPNNPFPAAINPIIGDQLPSGQSPSYCTYELGLTADAIRIMPKFIHADVKTDDFGPDVPAEVMANIAELMVTLNLVHYDRYVLDVCLSESLGGVNFVPGQGGFMGYSLAGAGTLLGRNRLAGASGCHFMGLNIISATGDEWNWRMPTSYLVQQPLVMPIGTRRSIATLSWRVIPYRPMTATLVGSGVYAISEAQSSGSVLWDHGVDS